LVLIVFEVEDLFLCRRLASVTRVLGPGALAGDGVEGAERRVDGIRVVGQRKPLAGHVGHSGQGSHVIGDVCWWVLSLDVLDGSARDSDAPLLAHCGSAMDGTREKGLEVNQRLVG
jgi:hypothetical protein